MERGERVVSQKQQQQQAQRNKHVSKQKGLRRVNKCNKRTHQIHTVKMTSKHTNIQTHTYAHIHTHTHILSRRRGRRRRRRRRNNIKCVKPLPLPPATVTYPAPYGRVPLRGACVDPHGITMMRGRYTHCRWNERPRLLVKLIARAITTTLMMDATTITITITITIITTTTISTTTNTARSTETGGGVVAVTRGGRGRGGGEGDEGRW